MLRIPCPWCGPRDEPEFHWGGEVPLLRPGPPETVSETTWAEYLFMRDNPKGWVRERWVHAFGCRQWFVVVRNTVTHEIRTTASWATRCRRPPSDGNAHRLESGGRIDRSCPLTFEFDGKRYYGFAGDTLASALLANGVRIVGRSFKLHRPRGLMAAWSEEPNGIVQLGSGATAVPNLKATQIELMDGLKARSVNCWPSASWDIFAFLERFGRMMPAGFYYKTFKWPSWHWFEPAIRRAAGLGSAPAVLTRTVMRRRYEHCDVLVVGGDPRPRRRACGHSRGRARSVADDRPVLGGSLQWEEKIIDRRPALEWVASAESELRLPQTRGCSPECDRVWLLRPQTPRARRADGRPDLSVTRAALARSRRPNGDRDGRDRAPNRLPGERCAGRHAGLRGDDYAVQYAVRPGDARLGHERGLRLRGRGEPTARGVEIAAIVDARAEPGEVASTARARNRGPRRSLPRAGSRDPRSKRNRGQAAGRGSDAAQESPVVG